MPEETLLIESNEAKTATNGNPYRLITSGDRQMACWEPGASKALAGETWIVETEQRGKFWNITKLIAQATEPQVVAKAKTTANGENDARETATNKRTALMQAVALAGYHIGQGKDFQAGQILVVAEEFNDWLKASTEDVPF